MPRIVIMGVSGCGKTTVGTTLADKIGGQFQEILIMIINQILRAKKNYLREQFWAEHKRQNLSLKRALFEWYIFFN